MLGLIISAAVAKDHYINKAIPAARSRSAATVYELGANPQHAEVIINRLTEVYATCSSQQVPQWREKLASMTGSYSFGGNFVYQMRPAMDGILIVAECVLTPTWGTGIGSVTCLADILNTTFFVYEDPYKQTVYVRSYHAQKREHIVAAKIFGEELLALIPYTMVQPVIPPFTEPEKSWWRKIFG
jgi:hypothetical protein